MKVMVVDDALTARIKSLALLRELGYRQVRLAANASEALRQLKELKSLDLLFVDWNMPGMNGIELIRRLRALPAYAQTKIVMVTAETGKAQIKTALEAGANDVIMKPFNREILSDKLRILGVPV